MAGLVRLIEPQCETTRNATRFVLVAHGEHKQAREPRSPENSRKCKGVPFTRLKRLAVCRPASGNLKEHITMNQFIIVQIREFSLPVCRAIEALGADVDKVVEQFNEELKSASIKTDKEGTPAKGNKAGLKVSISAKGETTIKTSDNRVAKVATSPLMRLKEIDQWALEGAELYVRMELTLPDSVAKHLEAKRYDNAERAKSREASEVKQPETANPVSA